MGPAGRGWKERLRSLPVPAPELAKQLRIGAVAKILGNTPAICRKCYIDPVVLESYLNGDIIEGLKRKTDGALESEALDLRASEVAILKFLQAKLAKKAA